MSIDNPLTQNLLDVEVSEANSSRHGIKRRALNSGIKSPPIVFKLISPKGMMMQESPSKASLAVSLVTDSLHNPSFKSPMSVNATTSKGGKRSNSPTSGTSAMAILGRELKHMSKYLDQREM